MTTLQSKISRQILSRLIMGIAALVFSAQSYAELQLNGIAAHVNLGKDQFVAALFCETLATDAKSILLDNGDKAMEVRVLAEQIYARRFKRMWIESMAINSGSAELEQHAQDMADFANFLKVNLRAGDILRIEKSTVTGVRVLIDGHELGVIENPKFFDLLLRAWVGPVPLSSSFKNKLLAGGALDDDTRGTFYSTTPTPERIVAIGTALTGAKESESQTADLSSTSDASSNEPAEPTKQDPKPTANTEIEVATAEVPPPAQVAPVTPKPKKPPAPVKVAKVLATEDDLFGDDSILDNDEDNSITAESLLSQQLYISKLTRWTGGFVVYPSSALRKNHEGTVRLTVILKRNGEVLDVEYAEKAGHKALNRAAFQAVKRASPYPAIPQTINTDTFVFTVPVVFRLN